MADKYIKKWSTSLLIKMLIKWQKENKEKKTKQKIETLFFTHYFVKN